MIIGFCGSKQSGKDTCCDYLVKTYGFQKKSFADPLKAICRELFFFTDQQLYGDKKEVADPNWYNCQPRTAFQYIGTDLLRKQLQHIMPGLGEDVFVHHLRRWYQLNGNPELKLVIADVRFHNEAEFIKSIGGVLVKVTRPVVLSDSHVSETELLGIECDYEIKNDATIEDLYEKLNQLI